MSDIKALEKLREIPTFDKAIQDSEETTLSGNMVCATRGLIQLLADEIQAEIDANYMRLPVDVDGEPIRVGDSVNMEDSDKEFTVSLVGDTCFRGQLLGTGAMETHYSRCCRHIKPRTLEGVLEDYADEYYRLVRDGQGGMVASKTRDAAAEIRELLGVDGDER